MRITSTSHHQIHKPTCICVHPSSPPPITTGEGTFILKRANFRNLGFLTHLSPSRRPLLLIFSTFPSLIVLTNKHMSSILKRKTCLDPTLAPPQFLSFLSFEVTLLKKLNFSISSFTSQFTLICLLSLSCQQAFSLRPPRSLCLGLVLILQSLHHVVLSELTGPLSLKMLSFLGFCDTTLSQSPLLLLFYSLFYSVLLSLV